MSRGFDLRDRLEIEHAVAQAPMAGGIARAELATAVAAAGGLGFVGMLDAPDLARELRAARHASGSCAVGAGLIVPFTRRSHVRACIAGGASVVLLFAGHDPRLTAELRSSGIVVLHQVGSTEAARRAMQEGADALVAQGVEAGGHVAARRPAIATLQSVLAVAGRVPVLMAGGVATAADARAALSSGASGVLAGTRFLLSPESRAHPLYKAAVLAADRTVLTGIFGIGWPMRHRVVANAVTDRWCRARDAGPRSVALVSRASRPLARLASQRLALAIAKRQRIGIPIFGPLAPVFGLDDALVEVMPLYAGETARRLDSIRAAGDSVRELGAATH